MHTLKSIKSHFPDCIQYIIEEDLDILLNLSNESINFYDMDISKYNIIFNLDKKFKNLAEEIEKNDNTKMQVLRKKLKLMNYIQALEINL